jgi:hypothetical protein
MVNDDLATAENDRKKRNVRNNGTGGRLATVKG